MIFGSLPSGGLGVASVGAEGLVQGANDLWVDAVAGHDDNDGLTPDTALRTIQAAADRALPGTRVRVLPGIYRESVRPAADGTADAPISYVAQEGSGTVVVRGSEPSSSLQWRRLSENSIGLPDDVDPTAVYYADLSGWDLDESPRFVVQLDHGGEVSARLPLAREPDWHVETDWRHHELWWTADGGSRVAECDPSDPDNDLNCDLPSRSATQLTDVNHYPEPDPRIEAGDLTSLGNLAGARLVALDAKVGHYVYRRHILDHEVAAGRITVDSGCLQDGGTSDPGLGWGSKYYLEDHPALLDSPGEWWYDPVQRRLYLWPPTAGDPAKLDIEISARDNGIDLTDRSHITLDGLTIELVNDNAVKQGWGHGSDGNTIRNATLRYANYGVVALRAGGGMMRDFLVEDSEIAHIDSNALVVGEWWQEGEYQAPNPPPGWQPSTADIVIRGNTMHDLGFRGDADNALGVKILFANQLRFEGNHVYDVAHNGVQFLWSVIDSDKTHDFSPDEIKTGGILIKDNVIEDTCQLTTDCAALKFWGQPPNNHVFRDVLVIGNVLRDNLAWSYVSEQRSQGERGWWTGGEACDVKGRAGFGLYLDYASGIHAYRNVAYNNAYAGFMLYGTWRDGDIVFYNNVVANSLHGFRLSGTEFDVHGGSVNTQIVNNIIATAEGYGIYQCTACGAGVEFGNTVIDHNLYFNSGWRADDEGGVWKAGAMALRTPDGHAYYQTVAEIQDHPNHWEAQGREGDPRFARYDPADHDSTSGARPDFHLTLDSTLVVGRGAELPASLRALLSGFGVDDPRWGSAWDIGRYEGGFVISASPATRSIEAGGAGSYSVSVACVGECASAVTLEAQSPDPCLEVALDPAVVTKDTQVALTVTDAGCADRGLHQVTITAAGGEFARTTAVGVLVGGSQVYLPMVVRGSD
ncbi:MAG: right-handed parallel beta-helix repeat-containing protein [Chloroflexota bacterium]